VLRGPRCRVYCKSAAMTFFMNDGVSIGLLLHIVSILQTLVGSCLSSLAGLGSARVSWRDEARLLLITSSDPFDVRTHVSPENSTCISVYFFFFTEKKPPPCEFIVKEVISLSTSGICTH